MVALLRRKGYNEATIHFRRMQNYEFRNPLILCKEKQRIVSRNSCRKTWGKQIDDFQMGNR